MTSSMSTLGAKTSCGLNSTAGRRMRLSASTSCTASGYTSAGHTSAMSRGSASAPSTPRSSSMRATEHTKGPTKPVWRLARHRRCAATAADIGAFPGGKIAASSKSRSKQSATHSRPGLLDTARPGLCINAIVAGLAGFAKPQRTECIDHDRQLIEKLGTQGRFDRRGLRPVAVAAGMDGDGALADARPLTCLVVAVDVKHHLVTVDIGVVIGHGDRQWMIVDFTRHEIADHEIISLKHLMYRRRLVDAAGDRFEIGDVERVRIQAPVPAHHVEGMARHHVHRAGQTGGSVSAMFNEHLDIG